MAPLAAGRDAPDFTLLSDAGENFRLAALRGRWVVLFFYPEDDTDGCTLENREFGALAGAFTDAGAVVAGISPDTVESHCRFRDKYSLQVPLLADTERKVARAYGVWGPKKMFGREYDGVIRTTFLVAPDGKIADIVRATRIKGHAAAVLSRLETLAQRQTAKAGP